MDRADKWNKGADNLHFDSVWQHGVAETFKRLYEST